MAYKILNITVSICPHTFPFATKIRADTPITVAQRVNICISPINILEVATTITDKIQITQSCFLKFRKGFCISYHTFQKISIHMTHLQRPNDAQVNAIHFTLPGGSFYILLFHYT